MKTSNVNELLKQAQMHISNGEITDAHALYATVLKIASEDDQFAQASETVESLDKDTSREPPEGLLARLIELYNHGEMLIVFQETAELINQYSNNYVIWNLMGASATQIEKFDQAVAAFLKVIEIKPDYVQAYNNLGTTYSKIGDSDLAIEAYENALSINPNYIEALNNLGQLLVKKGDIENAICNYRKVIALRPDYAGAYYNLGNAFKKLGNSEQAIEAWTKAVSLEPNYTEAYADLGIALIEQGDLERAILSLQKTITLKPDDAHSYNNLGIALQRVGDLQAAITNFKTAISLKPNYVEAINNLGALFKVQQKFDEALALYDEAISLNPHYADAHNNLGDLYREQGFYEEALLALKTAISLNPGFARAYNNLGATFKNLGRFDEAVEAFISAIEVAPKFADSYHNLGRLYWLLQNFEQAFELMEWRWLVTDKFIGDIFESVKPVWDGENGAEVFIWKEQGIGDQIMFGSMLSEVSEKSKGLVVECDERLIPLYERSFPAKITFIKDRNKINDHDYDQHIAIGSLARHLRKNLADFTGVAQGWLKADPQRTSDLRKKLRRNEKGKIIGISWFTESTLRESEKRDIKLAELIDSLKQVPATFVSLQYGDTAEELRSVSDKLGIDVVSISDLDLFNDIDGLAALISACDVVVSIDNTTVHLAGALGVDTRVLLSSVAEERWGTSGQISYWYESLHLYRQDGQQTWTAQLDQLTHDLNG